MARHIDIQDHLTESRVVPQSTEECCNLSDAAKMYFPVEQRSADLPPKFADKNERLLGSLRQTPSR
jgi:hypothetical protein